MTEKIISWQTVRIFVVAILFAGVITSVIMFGLTSGNTRRDRQTEISKCILEYNKHQPNIKDWCEAKVQLEIKY